MTALTIYDNYEITGCRRLDRAGLPDPEGISTETCDDADAQFWTLYGHIDGRGVEAIGDFADREHAEEVFQRIVGEPFTGSYEAGSRLRLLYAAPRLLSACRMVVERWESGDLAEAARTCQAAIDEASTAPPWVSAEVDVHAVLARRRQIAIVWDVEDVQSVRPDLSDDKAWQVLQQTSQCHDATIGIDWDVLECHASMLFGDAPELDEPEGA